MSYSFAIAIVVLFFAVQAGLWAAIVLWLRGREEALKRTLWSECIAAREMVAVRPRPALFQGAVPGNGLRRGNGILIVTEKRLVFERLTGGRIEIPRDDIAEVADRWKGRPRGVRGAAGEMVVIRRKDKSQYSFLLPTADEIRKVFAKK